MKISITLSSYVVIAYATSVHVSAHAGKWGQAPPSATTDYQQLSTNAIASLKVVLSTFDASRGGTLWLLQNGLIKSLASAKGGTLLPTISPDGKQVAFVIPATADSPLIDNAPFEVRVVDLDGNGVARVLIAPDRDEQGKEALAVAPQNILYLSWLTTSKLLLSGNVTPVSSIGFTIPVIRSTIPMRFPYGPASGSIEFDDAGPHAASPQGTHVASVVGVAPSKSYPSCPEVNESIEIDGNVIPMPRAIQPFSVVAPFAWLEENSLATIVHTRDGLALLRIDQIEQVFRLRQPDGVQRNNESGILNPPRVTYVPLPFSGSRAFVRLEPFFSAQQLEIRQFDAHGVQVDSWKVDGKAASRSTSFAQIDRDAAQRAASTDQLVRSVAHLLPAALANRFSTMHIWCRNSACGSLSNVPSTSQVGGGDTAPVPAACRVGR